MLPIRKLLARIPLEREREVVEFVELFWYALSGNVIKEGYLLRQARLDVPGTLHHVIIRGIEKGQIVADRKIATDLSSEWENWLRKPGRLPSKHNLLGIKYKIN